MNQVVQSLAGLLEGIINPLFGSLNASLNQVFISLDGFLTLKPFIV